MSENGVKVGEKCAQALFTVHGAPPNMAAEELWVNCVSQTNHQPLSITLFEINSYNIEASSFELNANSLSTQKAQ